MPFLTLKDANDAKLSTPIIHTLKKRILHWEYPPDYLLTEKDLCREFSVSRSPVREALRVLEASRLVHKKNTQGYLVKQLGLAEIVELYDFRLAIELFAVEVVTTNKAHFETILALRKEWVECELTTKSNMELAKIDEQFHEALMALTSNATLLLALQQVNGRLFIFRMIDFEQRERIETTYEQHLAILNAILVSDVPRAKENLRKNIAQARDYVHIAVRDLLVRSHEL